MQTLSEFRAHWHPGLGSPEMSAGPFYPTPGNDRMINASPASQDRARIVFDCPDDAQVAGMRLRLASNFLRFQHPRMRRYRHAFFSRIGPLRKPCGSRSTCHCHVGLSNRSAVEKMAPKVAFAKQKQLAQKTVGSRDHCISRVCSGLVDGVAQGCNIRSPVALA